MTSSVLLFLVAWCISACGAVGEPYGKAGEKVYYVDASDVDSTGRCGERVPCKTVQEYIKENATIFQTSGVTWVFLAGQHDLQGPLAMSNVHNVTLTGERKPVSSLTSVLSGGCLLLQNVGSLTLQYLMVDSLPLLNCSTFVEMMDSVRHFVIHSCNFQHLYSVVSITSELSMDCGTHFDLLIHGSVFNSGGIYDREALTIYMEDCVNGPKVRIEVERCHFTGSAISFQLFNSTLSSYDVQIKQTGFRFSANKWSPMMEFLLHIPYVSGKSLLFNKERIVNISECVFTVLHTSAISMLYTVDSECYLNPGHLSCHDIQPLVGRTEIQNCKIHSDIFRIHPVIESSLIDPCIDLAALGCPSRLILVLSNNSIIGKMKVQDPDFQLLFPDDVYSLFMKWDPWTRFTALPDWPRDLKLSDLAHVSTITFDRNRPEFYKYFEASVEFKGFRRFHASLAGGNYIEDSPGTGFRLLNAHLEITGVNTVTRSGYYPTSDLGIVEIKPECHGVSLTPDSLLLLHVNATLNITDNLGTPVGGGVYVSPSGFDTSCLAPSNLPSESCAELCFFQLVNPSGGFVSRESIPFHQAILSVTRNDAESAIGKDVFNGHLATCSMWTPSGLTTLDELHKKQYLITSSRVFPAISSFPYNICICIDNLAGRKDCTLKKWKRLLYPGQPMDLYVMVTGDYNYTVPSVVVIDVNGAFHDRVYLDASLAQGCQQVSLNLDICRLASEDKMVNVTLTAKLNVEQEFGPFIEREILFTFAKRCPPGFHRRNESVGCFNCTCTLARQHHIGCMLRESEAILTVRKGHYWLGIDEGSEHLLLSTYCPPFFCQGSPYELVIKKLPNSYVIEEQCQNGRQKILCSQCPEGQSSVFASFQCRPCSHLWLLLLPVFAVVGLLLLLFILLCNFTILQGTTHGVIIYSSIMNLGMDLFASGPPNGWIVLLALMNLDLGLHLCLYSGLDEFTKAVLQFVFPAYLLIILAVTTVFAHKYGYKIHRISIVAKRIVPVLATLVIITYTKLAEASVNGLLFTWMYDIDSQERKAVWLYDGSIGYFEGKHLFLALLSFTCIVLYILPVAIVALLGDLLRWCIHYHWLSHFIDVFHGAFRRPFGFWLGIRLLAIVLLVGLKIPFSDIHFTYCVSIVVGLVLVVQIVLRPFKPFEYPMPEDGPHFKFKMCMVKILRVLIQPTLLDALFLFNMAVTNMSFWMPSSSSGASGSPTIAVSVSFALALLVGVLVYHAYNFVPLPEMVKDALRRPLSYCIDRCAREEPQSEREQENSEPLLDPTEGFPPSFLRVTELRLLPPGSNGESSTEEDTTEN